MENPLSVACVALPTTCPRRQDGPSQGSSQAASSSQNAPGASSRSGPSFTVEATSGLHFAAFESEGSWSYVHTPRSLASSLHSAQATRQTAQPQPVDPMTPMPEQTAEHHELTPDPWMREADPWMTWLNQQQQESAMPSAPPSSAAPSDHPNMPAIPSTPLGIDIYSSNSWAYPGLPNIGITQSFTEVLGLNALQVCRPT